MTTEKRGPGRPRKNPQPAAVVEVKDRPPKIVNDVQNALVDLMAAGAVAKIQQEVKTSVDEHFKKYTGELETYLDLLKTEIKEHKHVTLTDLEGTKRAVKGSTHQAFEGFLKALQTSFPVMLIGPAGTGKTFSSEQAAEALEIPFYATSVGSQTSKSDLLGYMNAGGQYVRTVFREAFENGGLFLLDEIDAGNSNVLIVLNAALSGTFCSFPDGMVRRHKDFRCVAAGNTYGTGASRQYVGRNQLDAATLDRFLMFDWPIDEKLEASIISEYKYASRWHKVIKELRTLVEKKDMRLIVSPRATIKGVQLLEIGFSFQETLAMTVLANATKDHTDALIQTAKDNW